MLVRRAARRARADATASTGLTTGSAVRAAARCSVIAAPSSMATPMATTGGAGTGADHRGEQLAGRHGGRQQHGGDGDRAHRVVDHHAKVPGRQADGERHHADLHEQPDRQRERLGRLPRPDARRG